ncbi:iron ABC transporter permease [Aquisalimonas sp. 2447]|uniref:ABC transporter permease n=1 Tax=Aquisalimonas sp. 2447 TaxID=2740807 RepID=UPI00143236F5|nr:iron ABC transporter permease [Aquisalimonas sp. 2447]QIT54654.1 iron ABC transporter permease [Aquisalimonas sp. 2447]
MSVTTDTRRNSPLTGFLARLPKPESLLGWFIAATLVVLVGLPLAAILLHLAYPQLYLGIFDLGDFDLFTDLWERRLWRTAVQNSLYLSFGTMVIGTFIGAGMAYLRHTYRFPTAGLIDFAAWFVLVMPSFIIAQGWVLFGRSGGTAHQMGMPWLGEFIFSLPGLVMVMSLANFPLAYLAFSAALHWNVRSLEQAARLAGATSAQVVRTIKLPLLLPALLSAAILVFVDTVGDFGLPAAFLSVFRFPLIPYVIRQEIQTVPVSFEGAAVLASVLVAMVAIAITIQIRLLRNAGADFLTGGARPVDRPRPRFWPLLTGLNVTFLGLAIFAPLGTSLSVSFLQRYSAGFTLDNLTLLNYRAVLSEGSVLLPAMANSFGIAFGAALIALAVGFLAAYLLAYSGSRLRRFIDITSTVTLAVPGIVLAVGYILWWNQRWLADWGIQVYNTPWVIVLCSAAASIPIAVRVVLGNVAQVPKSFLNSAALQGAGLWTRIRTVLMPLTLAGLLSAGLAVFATSVFDLAITTMLQPSGFPTIPVIIDEHFRTVQYGWATAATVIVCLITASIIVTTRFLVKRLFRQYFATGGSQ